MPSRWVVTLPVSAVSFLVIVLVPGCLSNDPSSKMPGDWHEGCPAQWSLHAATVESPGERPVVNWSEVPAEARTPELDQYLSRAQEGPVSDSVPHANATRVLQTLYDLWAQQEDASPQENSTNPIVVATGTSFVLFSIGAVVC